MKIERNSWKIVAISLIIFLIILGIYIGLQEVLDYKYQQGLQDGQYALILEQTTRAEFFYLNNSGAIFNIPLTELCGGGE